MAQDTSRIIQELAKKFDFSEDTVRQVWHGLVRSGGTQVQFNTPELGGFGQWQNGMIMIGDWNNHGLKARISSLIAELAPLAASAEKEQPAAVSGSSQQQFSSGRSEEKAVVEEPLEEMEQTPTGGWQGSQNGISYVFYPEQSVLVLSSGERYSTAKYQVLGMGQSQQNGRSSLVVLTDKGDIPISELTRVE